MQGDWATPEGKYHVSKVKNKGQTSYYRAFLIDYPTAQDWEEFRELKKAGKIPEKIKSPGSLVEIHGGVSHGYDWTAGCIFLRNQDIDKIFPYIKRKTPVTIVKYDS